MKNLCIFLEKSQAVVVVISTVFINPDIYMSGFMKTVLKIWSEYGIFFIYLSLISLRQ